MASSHLPDGHAPGTQRAGTAAQNERRGFARIKLGGRHRPLKFNYNALCHFCDLEGLSTSALETLDRTHTRPGHIRALIFAGLCEGARVSGEPLQVKEGEGKTAKRRQADLYDVGDWIGTDQDENDGDNVKRAMDLFQESQADDDEKEADEGGDEDDVAPLETAPKENGATSDAPTNQASQKSPTSTPTAQDGATS